VAIMTGVMIAVLLAFLGLVVDLGRMFVAKSELQTAMDACALASASQLRPGSTVPDENVFDRARSFGRSLSDASRLSATGATRPDSSVNRVVFQSQPVVPASITIDFSTNLSTWTAAPAATDSTTMRYARCTYPYNNLPVLFMRLVGAAPGVTVSASASATLAPSVSTRNCLFPIAICAPTPAAGAAGNWGFAPGDWIRSIAQDNAAAMGPGRFGFFDANGGANSAAELDSWIQNEGYCGPVVNEFSPGANQTVQDDYNSRFGLYKNGQGNPSPPIAPPERTGRHFTDGTTGNGPANWPAARNAYAGSPPTGMLNFQQAAAQYRAYDGPRLPGFNRSLADGEMDDYAQANRRLVPVPVFSCPGGGATPTRVPNDGMACVLLLHPITDPKNAVIEFVARAGDPDFAACAGVGGPGGSTSTGVLVPTLVE
jgi:Flp pilus assembly protein TadG